MNIMALLSFFACLVYLFLIQRILAKQRLLTNKIFAGLMICFLWWSFWMMILYNPGNTEQEAITISHISSYGWLFAPAFFLWFMLAFTQKSRILKQIYIYILIMGIPLFLTFLKWLGVLIVRMDKTPYGWRGIWGKGFWSFIGMLYICGFLIFGIFLGLRYIKKSDQKMKVKQIRVIIYSALFSLLIAISFDILMPSFLKISEVPDLANLTGIIWCSWIVYAIIRYRFLDINPVTAAYNIIETMFDCLVLIDCNGMILSVNNATADLLGFSKNKLENKPLSYIFPPDSLPVYLLNKLNHKQGVRNEGAVLRSKKGDSIPVLLSSSYLTDSYGNIYGTVCIIRDIGELKKNELLKDVLLKISEATPKTRNLYNLLQTIHQEVGRLIDVSNFYVALVHDQEKALYTFPFIMDVNPDEIEPPDKKIDLSGGLTQYVHRTQKPLLANQSTFDKILREGGAQLLGHRSKSWLGVPLKMSEDEVIGVIVIQSYTDPDAYSDNDLYVLSVISNSIASAIKYKQAEEALKNSEEHYRTLVENIHDGVFLIYKGKFEFVNDSFARILGYSVKELEGIDFIDLVQKDKKKSVMKVYQKREKNRLVPDECEFKVITKQGKEVYVNMNVGIINYQGGIASIGTIKDISERYKSEREKKELEEKLARSEKMEAIGRLAGGVAHDLNNVLGAIVGYPDLLLNEIPKDSRLRQIIESIQFSGQKASAIVQDLLALARRGVAIKETVNLNNIITQYINSPEFDKVRQYYPKMVLETYLKTDIPNIEGSPFHLSKIFMNLVSNAAEAMPDGGVLVISTEYRSVNTRIKGYYREIPPGEYVVVNVSDSGIGIDRKDLKMIFEPFFTKKEMGRSGTGLGMAVVWGTVEDHKGIIDVTSVEGKGAAFMVYFPVSRNVIEKKLTKISLSEYSGNQEKILVVDDMADQRQLISILLSKLNYSVSSVSSGEEAIKYIRDNPTDLIILDMIMEPGMDGLDTYREMVKILPDLKVIISSGFSESTRVKEVLKLGARTYIRKPYRIGQIGLAVRDVLKG